MEDIRMKLDGKDLNNEYMNFAIFISNIPKENRKKQIKVFPLTDEWAIDLNGGRFFRNRKYVFVENVDGIFEIVLTNNRRKFENFVNSRTADENNFLNSLKKNSKKYLN